MKALMGKIQAHYARRAAAYSIGIAVAVLVVDYLTGRAIQFPILFVLPIGLAAWHGNKRLAYTLAVILPIIRLGFHVPWHEMQSLPVGGLNCAIQIAILLFYTGLISKLYEYAAELKKRVKVLEGILPICSSCKKIRNSDGIYEQMEKYITEHSDALFSHGMCHDCMKKLYPDFDLTNEELLDKSENCGRVSVDRDVER